MTTSLEPIPNVSGAVDGARSRRVLRAVAPYRWVAIRLGLGLLTLFIVSLLIFVATSVLPGDAARAILGRQARLEALVQLRHELGLDRPLVDQYLSWISGVLTGDLGTSLTAQVPVSSLVGPAAANTFTLMFLGLLIAVPLSIGIGCITAVRRDTRVDRLAQFASLILTATPEFIIGIVLVLVFSTAVFQVLPAVALIPAEDSAFQHLDQLVLPVATVVLLITPYLVMLIRAAVIDALESEYVVMARLKGLSERRVVLHHAFRNALAPTLQALALSVAYLTGGLVVVEFLFNYPGLGGALANAVATRDLPMIQAVVLTLAATVIVANLLADLLTVLATPRLRTGGRR
jgi:peptide/nickel transport system permease protein